MTGLALLVAACDVSDSLAPDGMRAPDAVAGAQNVVPVVDVYVAAHQDDWQLFAGDKLAASARGTTAKVVAIYTTAGDANRVPAYWLAREDGARRSLDTLIGPGPWTCAATTVNAHPIQRCAKGKAVSYFLRLPDGNRNGDGYGSGSLKLLQAGTQTLSAKDGSTTYASWADLTGTLRAIVVNEAGGNASPYVQVYAHERDRIINPADHDDHFRTGDATRDAMQGLPYDLGWYVGYQTQYMAANVGAADLAWKKAEFWRYCQGLGAAGYACPWSEPVYQAWLQRTYVRYVDYVPPGPPTAPSNLAGSATHAVATLTWTDNASDETLFRVQRAPDVAGAAGTFDDVATATANAVTFNDATVSPATSYWYRVRSESNGGVSAYTDGVLVTTSPLPPPPQAPADLQGSALSGSRIDLSWTDVTGEESYQLERAPDAGGAAGTYAPLATLPPNATAYSDNGLMPNTRYWYRLRAVNVTGASAFVEVSQATSSAFEVDVYLSAYPDDWQMHVGDRVSASMQAAQRVVLIYTTAGDQGFSTQYWQSRERASRASVDTVVGPGAWTCAPRTMASHSILRCEKGKVIAYYMRMPDGRFGDGYGGRGSLTNLKKGQPTSALDGSTTYATWADFVGTLQTIIATETGGQSGPFVEVTVPEYDAVVNPGDRLDRYRTGEAILSASLNQGWDLGWYVGRHSQNLPVNVSGAAYDAKVIEYRAYDKVMRAEGHGSTWSEVQAWLSRTYVRLVPSAAAR